MHISIIGTLDLSTANPRIIQTNGDATRSTVLASFTRTMWQVFNHGERVQVSGAIDGQRLDVQSIMKLS